MSSVRPLVAAALGGVLAGPEGPGPTIVETLAEDLDALVARVPAVVKKLFP